MKISVITVTYNAEDLIEQTIESVASQDYDNVEHLIIDGQSTDKTIEIVKRLEGKISRWISEPDDGIYDAMNKAIKLSSGEWINFLNAGDTFCHADTLSKVANELETDADFVYGDRCRISENGKSTFEAARPIEETMLREAVFHQSLFNRRATLSDGYSRHYELASDFEFVVRAFKSGKKFKKLDLPVCNFLEGGTSRKHFTMAHLETMKILYQHQDGGNQWKESDFYQHFVGNNIGFYLNSKLQKFRRIFPGFKIAATNNSTGNVVFTANKQNSEVEQFINKLNQPFAALYPENRKEQIIRLARKVKSKALNLVALNRTEYETMPADIELTPDSPKKQKEPGETPRPTSDLSPTPQKAETVSTSPLSPRITIATVSYNAEKEIEPTLKSVTGQDYENMEYIVIDGASSDSTIDIIEGFRNQIDQLVVESDNGIYDAMNKAIKMSTGDYLLFMNAGDTFCDPHTLSQMAEHLHDDPAVLYGDRYYVALNGKSERQNAKPVEKIFERMPYCHQAALTKTKSLREHLFNTTYKYAADYNQVVQIYRAGERFKKIDLPVCNFTAGGKSESGIRPYLEVLKIQFDNCSDNATIKDSMYFRAFKNNVDHLLDI